MLCQRVCAKITCAGINMGSVQQATYSQRGGKDVVIDRLSGNLGPTLRFGAAPPVNPRFTPLVSKMVMPAVAVPMGSAGLKVCTGVYVAGFDGLYGSLNFLFESF